MLLTAFINEQSKDDEALDEEFVDENAAGGDGDDDDALLLLFTFQPTKLLLLDGIVTKLRTIFIIFFCFSTLSINDDGLFSTPKYSSLQVYLSTIFM